jgi:two-component system response regulator YesN
MKGHYYNKIIISMFLIVAIISVIVFSGFYINSLKEIKYARLNLNKEIIKTINQSIDFQIKNTDRTILRLSYNLDINKFFSKDYINSNYHDLSQIYNIIKTSNHIVLSDPDINSVYIYSFKNDYVISDGKYLMTNFYDNDFKNHMLSLKDFNIIISEQFISVIRTFPIGSDVNNGIIVVNLKKDFLKDVINDIKGDNAGDIYIKSENDNIIISTGDNYNGDNKKASSDEIVVENVSELTGWRFFYSMDQDEIIKSCNSTRVFTLGLLILTIVISGILILVLSNLLYKPVRIIAKNIRNNNVINDESFKDEFEYIRQSYSGILLDNEQLAQTIEEYKPVLRERFLYNLLKGETCNRKYFHQKCKYFNIVLDKEDYTVITCEYTLKSEDSENQNRIDVRLVNTIMEGLRSEGCNVFFIDLYLYRFALLLNHKKEYNVADVLAKLIENTKNDNYHVNFGIGNTYKDYQSIKDSYYQSAYTIQHIYILHSINTIMHINDVDEKKYHYPFHLEKQLINAIQLRENGRIDAIIKQISFYIADKGVLCLSVLKDIFMQLSISILRLTYERGDAIGNNINEKEIYNEIQASLRPEQLEQHLRLLSNNVIELFAKKDENRERMEQLISYIKENYSQDFSVSLLADKIYTSTSHLQRIFKQYTGKTIVEYINHIRINEAIKLLLDTTWTAKKISMYVGYNNSQNFLRHFKLMTGMTPVEYRNKHCISL